MTKKQLQNIKQIKGIKHAQFIGILLISIVAVTFILNMFTYISGTALALIGISFIVGNIWGGILLLRVHNALK